MRNQDFLSAAIAAELSPLCTQLLHSGAGPDDLGEVVATCIDRMLFVDTMVFGPSVPTTAFDDIRGQVPLN